MLGSVDITTVSNLVKEGVPKGIIADYLSDKDYDPKIIHYLRNTISWKNLKRMLIHAYKDKHFKVYGLNGSAGLLSYGVEVSGEIYFIFFDKLYKEFLLSTRQSIRREDFLFILDYFSKYFDKEKFFDFLLLFSQSSASLFDKPQ